MGEPGGPSSGSGPLDRPFPESPPVAWPPPPPPRKVERSGPWRATEDDRRRRSGRVAIAALVVLAIVGTALGSLVGSSPMARLAVESDHDFAFLRERADGSPFRWDPCAPIRYEVNLSNAPASAMQDVRGAIARTAAASGFRFAFEGTTTRTVDQQLGRVFQTGSTQERWLPVLIQWVPHDEFDELAETHRAAAFGMPRAGDGDDFATYESGLIAVDAGGGLAPGFAERYSDGVVLMHELGHVLGLGHVAAGDELMWSPDVSGAQEPPDLLLNHWGAGDRHGLEILGRHAACG